MSPGREGAARAGQGDAAGGGPRNPGRSDRGTASSERAWAGRVGRGGQGSGLRPRPLTVQAGVGGERLRGGAQDARTSEVSVPKEQRLEEVGDHRGHTASPGQAGRGDPGLPTFAWTSWLRLIVTAHFSPSPPSCPSLASLPSCPHKGVVTATPTLTPGAQRAEMWPLLWLPLKSGPGDLGAAPRDCVNQTPRGSQARRPVNHH